MFRFSLFCVFLLTSLGVWGQNGTLSGVVRDKNTQELLVGATVRLEGTDFAAATDLDGAFLIEAIPPKTYNVVVTYVGYTSFTRSNVNISNGNVQNLVLELSESATEIGAVEVTINKSTRVASVETPLSIQSVSVEEIKNNPGGNFDISRVLQALPGVSGSSDGGGRNDLIIRGGGPSENVFYLDGIEIPQINHFQTQGASGGPVGLINVLLIEDAVLSSSAFNARYDGALSSVLQFKQREGNLKRLQGNVRVSTSESILTLDGPIGKKSSFLASGRRSYLKFLFELIDLPIRPDYWDFQYKVTRKIDDKTTLNVIGIGAIDKFFFGTPKTVTPENTYILGSAPIINQWNYTQGFALRRLVNDGYYNIVASRNMFDNSLDQFSDNFDGKQRAEEKRILLLRSQEIENKLRFDYNKYYGQWKVAYGAGAQYVKYNNQTALTLQSAVIDSSGTVVVPAVKLNYDAAIDFYKFGAFGQVNRTFFDERLSISAGLRFDGNTFTDAGTDIWRTASPRVSASYGIAPGWKLNASVGRYYKLPAYLTLGYKSETGAFVNKTAKYLRSDHFVLGTEWVATPTLRFTVEGFLKEYANYPVSIANGISLANLGGTYGTAGNEAVASIGGGRSYGLEVFAQQKLAKRLFLTASATVYNSSFSGTNGKLVRSAWDQRFLLSTLVGYKLKNNWELGLKYRYQGGAPFTPYDLALSQQVYATTGDGALDYPNLNSGELKAFSQLDLRVNKKFNYRRLTIDLYLDVTNALAQTTQSLPNYTFARKSDNSDWDTTDGNPLAPNGSNAKPVLIDNISGNVIPGLGVIVEF